LRKGNINVTIESVEVLEYLEPDGRSPYADWFDGLNPPAAAKVTIALSRLSQRNFSNAKGVGGGVYEYRIDFGPGYRMYFSKDGERIALLLDGRTKKRQQKDIAGAISRWQDYKRRKKQEIR
jgi:putative addiction module killer protein